MSTKRRVLRGGQRILGVLNSGSGDSLLTQNLSTGEVRKVPSIDPSTYLQTSLLSAKIFIGNASNIATAQTITGAIVLSNTGVASIANNVIIDANIATNAAIAYSKLELDNSIINSDISPTANIAKSKIVAGTPYSILVNNSSGIFSEQAVITPNRLIISDANGLPIASSITSTQVSYIDPSSSIQTQLNNRLIFNSAITPSSGDLVSYISGQWNRVPLGTAGQYLAVNGGATGVQWVTVPNGVPTGGTTAQFLNKIDGTNFNTQWSTLTLGLITDVTATLAQVNALATGFYDATSSIQTQLNGKLPNILPLNALFVGNSSNVPIPLAAGTNGQILQITAGVPTWQTVSGTGTVTSVAFSGGTTGLSVTGSPITTSGTITLTGTLGTVNGGTNITSYTTGDILYASASNVLSKLAVGTNGYVLTLTAGIPTWAAPSGGGGGWPLTGNALYTGDVNIDGFFNITLGDTTALASYTIGVGNYAGQFTFLQQNPNGIQLASHDEAVPQVSTIFIVPNAINISGTSPTFAGATYDTNYSANYTLRSLVDKGYVLGVKTYTGKQIFTQTTTTSPINLGGFTSDPSVPLEGEISYNLTSHLLKFYNGTSWISTGGGGGITNSAPNQYLMLSDGTNAISSGIQVASNYMYKVSALSTSFGNIYIGVSPRSGVRTLEIETSDSPANTVYYALRVTSAGISTHSNGFGSGIEICSTNSSGVNKIGSTVESVSTNISAGSESFDIVFKTMSGGSAATEKLRFSSFGGIGLSGANYGTTGQVLTSNGSSSAATWTTVGGSGTVTTVGFTGGLISVATPTTTPAFTVAGTSGGIPYFSSTSTWASSALLAANALMIGGGTGVAPSTTTTGTGILTWLGTPSWTNFNSAITGTAPFWLTTGTTTLTSNTTQTGAFTNTFSLNGIVITQNTMSSGWNKVLAITSGNHTALTSTTPFIANDFLPATWTWIDGTITSQVFNHFGGFTVNKTTTSVTCTDIYTTYIDPSIAGTGVTFTRNWALGLGGGLQINSASQQDIAMNGSTLRVGTFSNNTLLLIANNTTRYSISGGGAFVSTGGPNVVFQTFTQAVNTTGASVGLLWTAGAHTSQTTATEVTDINWNLSAVMKMIDGTVPVQRAFRIQGRTYTPQTSTLVLTEASTLEVNPSIAGAGTTITNNYAIKSTGKLGFTFTYTAGGTNGNQTINLPSGSLNIAAAGTTVTLTNNLITTNSIVVPILSTDTTATSVTTVVTSGQCVFTLNAACTAAVKIQFIVFN